VTFLDIGPLNMIIGGFLRNMHRLFQRQHAIEELLALLSRQMRQVQFHFFEQLDRAHARQYRAGRARAARMLSVWQVSRCAAAAVAAKLRSEQWDRPQIRKWGRSADFQSAVSRVSNLLASTQSGWAWERHTRDRLEIGDTADWKSALHAGVVQATDYSV